jgi:2-hydroxycyclohexanecarboxyl-CoA dehydrogenase
MDLDLKDKRVVITGGASHIGQSIVFQLAGEGARIAIIDRDVDQAERTAVEARRRSGRAVHVVGADVGDKAVAEAACTDAIARLGGIDVLITNVGYNHPDFFLKTPPESWDALIAVNLVAVMACVRAALPAMVEQGHGAIVSTASTAAFGEPRQGVYVVAFIRTIALEYGRHGVRANLVAPGLTLPDEDAAVGDQSLWRDRHSVMNDAQVDYVVKNTPLRRLPKSEDIANAVTFLASDTAARLITGQLITVAGGFAMR